jgi:uncharacterized protein YndB with AHSA1/START domain
MTVIETQKEVDTLTLTFVSEFEASVERVWRLWEDPRQLERWWGPPTWPATFSRHEFVDGGEARYAMTGPDGEKAPGWWRFLAIDPPRSIRFDDGFAREDGEPDLTMPVIAGTVTFEDLGGSTRMTITSTFTSAEQYEQTMEMGMEDGMRLALGQIEGILAEG